MTPRPWASSLTERGTGLRRMAQYLAHDPAAADDALQGTFLAAIERPRDLGPDGRVEAWLAGILIHQIQRQRRYRALDRSRAASGPVAEAALASTATTDPSPTGQLAAKELEGRVSALIAGLPAAYAEPLRRRLLAGDSAQSIAHDLGLSLGTVHKRLSRGLKKLRRVLPAALSAPALGRQRTASFESLRAQLLETAAGQHAAWTVFACPQGRERIDDLTVVIHDATTGRVRVLRAADGKPVPGARVALVPASSAPFEHSESGRALGLESRERAWFLGAELDRAWSARAGADGWAKLSSIPAVARQGVAINGRPPFHTVILHGGAIEHVLTVTRPDPDPAGRATLRLVSSGTDTALDPTEWTIWRLQENGRYRGEPIATAKALPGALRMEDLAPGTWQAKVSARDHRPAVIDFEVCDGDELDLLLAMPLNEVR